MIIIEAVTYLTSWIKWLIPLIIAGAVFRTAYCCFKLVISPDDAAQIKKSINNTLVASAIMITILSFIQVLKSIFNFS